MTVVSAITQVGRQLVNWLSGIFSTVETFFISDGTLTFAGVMAVVMAGISLILLVFNLIRSFLPMRG